MRILSKMRKQTAVYWGEPVSDGRGGTTYADPVELTVRWEDRTERFVDPKTGQEVLSRAVVFVGQEVEVGGALLLGTLADLSTPAATPQESGAAIIRQYESVPTLKATEFLRTAYL